MLLTEAQIRVGERLLSAHEAVVGLIGQERMTQIAEKWRPVLDEFCRHEGCSTLEAGMKIVERMQEQGVDAVQQLQLVAATAELVAQEGK